MMAAVANPATAPAASSVPCTRGRLETLLSRYDGITLAEMDGVKLLNRVDTKFLLAQEQLLHILAAIPPYYRVMRNGPVQSNLYRTQYFDTADFRLYMDHHNDRRERYKVRSRTYMDSGVTFLEIKHKTKQGRINKVRQEIEQIPDQLEGDNLAFVRAHYPDNPWLLEPVIWNTFRRITLVSKHRQERLTIDLDLRSGWRSASHTLAGVAIVEVKQPKYSPDSDFIREMRQYGIFRTGFSKYCTGMSAIYPHLRANRFKRRQLLVARLQRIQGA